MMIAVCWLIAGIVLMLAELLIPGFVIFFFGAGAILTAGLTWLAPECAIGWQVIFFALASVLMVILSRACFPKTFAGKDERPRGDVDSDGLVGSVGKVSEAIEPPSSGRVVVQGTTWMAVSDRPIPAGKVVTVVKCDNITLTVR